VSGCDQIASSEYTAIMDLLPTEIRSLIYAHALYDNVAIRSICKEAALVFDCSFVKERTRPDCRETMCRKQLSQRCIYGRYCSYQCMVEHSSGL